MDQKRAKRIRRRIICDLVIDGKRQSGIVLDVSATGLFVQTAISKSVGQVVEVHLAATRTTPELSFHARVARARRVPPQLLAAAGGGFGLCVIDPPPGFAQLLAGDDEAIAAAERAPEPVAAAPSSPTPRSFRVRLQAGGGMRTRSVTVQSPDAKAARAQACAVVGGGWEVVDVSEQP